MRIVVAHNRYQLRGGEDAVVDDEIALLRAAGHDVETVFLSNDAIRTTADKVRAAWQVADAPAGIGAVVDAVRRHRPDVVHVHNFFPLMSPAVHRQVRALGPATVQTLHNFRLTCANGILLRQGLPCQLCVEGSPLNAVRHRCYRGSTAGSAAVARMIGKHRRDGTWRHHVDRFVALSPFARDIFVRAGLPAARIAIKPNAVDDGETPAGAPRSGILYVGRLSEEKGVRVLLEAARLTRVPITVVGEGPLAGELAARAPPNLTLLGWRERAAARVAMTQALAVVVPSICYEGFPVTVAEAFAAETPVIASRIGALAAIVEDGRTGWHTIPGDAADLAAAVERVAGDAGEARRRGAVARQAYLARYTRAASLAALETIYAAAIESRRGDRPEADSRRPLQALSATPGANHAP